MQRSGKVSRCSPKRQTFIWSRTTTESGRNNFCRFREHQIALSAYIEAMFLQIAVPSDDSRCLRSLWREHPEHNMEVYGYTRHLFGAKSSPTCADYALHQVAKDNAVYDESLVKTVQRKFYMDDFLKSVRTPQEAIGIYLKVRDIFSKGGFKSTKWITSDEEVKSQIPETDRSTKVVKTLKAELQSSSILGLNWNVKTDRLIVCRGTEQELPAKITQRIVLSFVSAVFDPLGVCSPFILECDFYSKVFRQRRDKHGTKSWQQNNQKCSVIGVLS